MIIEHEHNNYPNNYKLITDGRVLKSFIKRGFIKDYCKTYKYVDSFDYYNSDKNITSFEYKNNLYQIKYFDGCFNPFIIKII